MYLFQGQCYSSLDEVPVEILNAFIEQNTLNETVIFLEGKPLYWEEHYLRLMASMRILRMEIPMSFTMEQLQSSMAALCLFEGKSKFTGRVRLSVVKTTVPTPGQAIPATAYAIKLLELKEPFSFHVQELPIDLYKDHYVAAGLYASLENAYASWRTMAWTYVHENGYCDGILLNNNKQVVETLHGALFLVNGSTITTPALGVGNRKGIYRQQLISLLQKEEKFEVLEAEISPFALQKADELFVLDDAQGLFSIGQYRKKKFGYVMTQAIWELLLSHIQEGH